MENVKYHPRFFDLPRNYQCIMSNWLWLLKVPVLLMASFRQPDGRFELSSSEICTLQKKTDRKAELMENAERIPGTGGKINPQPLLNSGRFFIQSGLNSLPAWFISLETKKRIVHLKILNRLEAKTKS